jgi:GIY-YIG catalytic domain
MKAGAASQRGRQPALFRLEDPLTLRFGSGFFAALPTGPGVYFFRDAAERLLYIGQSSCLKARLGSYRHVTLERHPVRSLRLVARVRKIDWETCETAAEAIERERVLLLEHRPPFNRAGVWAGDPWWLTAEILPGVLRLQLGREAAGGIGPLPASFRYRFGTLARCVYRVSRPELGMHQYPHGLAKQPVPLGLSLPLPDPGTAWELLAEGALGRAERLLEKLDALLPPESLLWQEFWTEEREAVGRWPMRQMRKDGSIEG